jgi:hypothetical protein
VEFADRVLVQLADPSLRGALFDDMSLAQLIAAAYDESQFIVDGPFEPVFDSLRIGIPVPRIATFDGYWCPTGTAQKVDMRLQGTGFCDSFPVRVDALWHGHIVARRTLSSAIISQLTTTWPDLASVDATIAQDLGALPADPAQLEAERRARVLARLRAGLSQPDALTDVAFDHWLERSGASSVGELVTAFGGILNPATVALQFSTNGTEELLAEALPITVALLIRNAPVSLADLLMQSKQVRQPLSAAGLGATARAALPLKEPLLIGWMLPTSVFEDTDWPGADATARRANAGAWLAHEGIGLMVTG